MLPLALLFGAVVGFSLGLTGGGGSIFAVHLLVYGLGTPAHEAVGASLAAVGATALIGSLQRIRAGEVEVRAGLIFAIAGMAGAPAGATLGARIPEAWLLLLFAVLMVVIASRMWVQAGRADEDPGAVRARIEPSPPGRGPACRSDPLGRLHLTSRCALALLLFGIATGLLAGLFGVGGGFVIVPALVLLTGINIHRAVATSLLVITLVSASGVATYVAAGRPLDWVVTGVFIGGGALGLLVGTMVGRRLTGPRLQRVFAAAILAVAAYVIGRTALG